MKLAIAYSTKDQVELSEQTFPVVRDGQHALFWCDGSKTEAGISFVASNAEYATYYDVDVTGSADAAIAWKLSKMLASPANYTHIGLLENDVLLDPDWLVPTLELFEKGERDGLSVGAVSPRSYVDRVLIQRDGWAVMHNLGAGVAIFTRAAADVILRTLRTHWWPDNVRLFGRLSGIDLRTYAAFRGNEQHVTTDWGWEAQLARHGLASLALTPSRCTMVGQTPSLVEQGLELTTETNQAPPDTMAFVRYRDNLARLRLNHSIDTPALLHRQNGETLIFPHQLPAIGATWAGTTELKWSQGFGPFAYRAGPGGASLSALLSGSVSYLLTGGDAGAKVTLTDTRSGFNFSPQLPAAMQSPASISVPGSPIPRLVTVEMGEAAVLYGLSCADPQMIDTSWRFDWSQLPEAR